MDFEKYKLKIYYPLAIVIIIAAFTSVVVNYYFQKTSIIQTKHEIAPVFLRSFQNKIDESAKIFTSYLNLLSRNTEMQHLFLDKDRDRLYDSIEIFYRDLNQNIDLTHLYFIEPDGTVFLRGHDPERHSDAIRRYTFEQSRALGKLYYGLEFGANKNYTLRVVKPWIVDGSVIGYLELGKEIDKLMQVLASEMNLDLFLAIDKHVYDTSSEALKEQMLEKPQTRNQYVVYQTGDFHERYIELFEENVPEEIQIGERHYAVYLHPLLDVSGELLGQMLFLMEMTEEYHVIQNATLTYAVVIIIIVLMVLGVLTYFVRKEEDQITTLSNKVTVKTSLLEEANERLEKYLSQNQELLSQYKVAVDKSSIVSKTDLRGIITYVNDAFCEISGYSKDELIGKPHNIVRHPDMPSEAFEEMWQTIRNKQPWQGVVKNLKKDGGYYIVETTVMPLMDENGEIQEYISIRYEITEMIDLKNEIIETQKEIIYTLGELGESRSKETSNHVKRVAEYSKILALEYGLSETEANLIRSASPMHDIGKVAIPDNILLKRGKLEETEFNVMMLHAEYGYNIFKNSNREILKAAAIIAYHHHEKWDGTGYPQGLEGEEIHIYGRITALADVFDALASERVYKQAWPIDEVLNFIEEESGKQFDPALVDVFFGSLHELLRIHGEYP